MKKAIIVSLIVFLSFPLIVFASDWIKLKNNKNTPLYLNSHSIEYNRDYKTAIYSIKYQTPQNKMNFILIKSDCKKNLACILKMYNNLDLNSNFSDFGNTWFSGSEAIMLPVKPNTLIAAAHNYVCEPLKYTEIKLQETAPQKTLQEVDSENYLEYLKIKVFNSWQRPDYLENEIIINFTISRDGTLISNYVEKSSENYEYDHQALMAVDKASPFEPFPETADSDTWNFRFSFK